MAIEMREVTKHYDRTVAVDRITMTIPDNGVTVLIGPSGCGKTTILTMLNRLVERTSGEILFSGRPIDRIDPIELRRSIGYVIQEIGLFPHMTVGENITVVPKLLKWDRRRIGTRLEELMELVNLPFEYADRYPDELSGGQRQRVGVARGLAADPQILLMDEPFGAIDPINRERLQDSFLEIQRTIKKTVVFVTHDMREALKVGDRLAILDKGRLVQYDETLKVVRSPANRFVEQLLGADRALKELEVVRVADNFDRDFFSLRTDREAKVGEACRTLAAFDRRSAIVLDPTEQLVGYLNVEDLESVDEDEPIRHYVRPIRTTKEEAPLLEALTTMLTEGRTSLPVVDQHGRVLGMLRFRELFRRIDALSATISE